MSEQRQRQSSFQVSAVHHITLVVGDLSQTRWFYEDLLGLEPISRPDYDFAGAWYRCGEIEIHLLVAEEHAPPSRRHVAFQVDDFDRVIRTLDHQRVRVVGGPGRRPHDGTRYVFLQDPAGNLVEVASPGASG